MFTIDSLMTRLRRVNPFTYLVGIQLDIQPTSEPAIVATTGGHIRFSQDVLDNKCASDYNIIQWNEPALTFILAHEISHIILGHCDKSVAHDRCYAISPYITWLAIETHCNWFTIEQLKYSIANLVKPVDPSKPVMTYADNYGFDPNGLHWTEIFDKLLQSGKIDPDTAVPNETPNDYEVGTQKGTLESLTPEQLDAAIRRAGNMASLPSSLRHLEITVDKASLPWSTLVARIQASAQESAGTWAKANRKGLPLRGRGMKPKAYEVLLYFDTSGSVDEKIVNKIVTGLLSKPNVPIHISYLSFDTAIYGDKSKRNEPIKLASLKEKLALQGGGGTDFQAVANHWNSIKSKYDLAINITDGEDTLPKEALSKYVWLIHGGKHFTAPEPVFLLDA